MMDNRDSALGTQVATLYEIFFWLLICALSLLLVASPGWSFEWTPQTVPALTADGTDGADGTIVLVVEGKRDSRGGSQGSTGMGSAGSGPGGAGGAGGGTGSR